MRPLARILPGVALALVAPARGRAPPPARPLTLGEAVARAAAAAPAVAAARLGVVEARERTRQASAALLPGLGAAAGWTNRTFNRATLGLENLLPSGFGGDALVGPFDVLDARVSVQQPLVDIAARRRVAAARARTGVAEAGGALAAETAAERAALAYLAAARAAANLAARLADSTLAAELVALAREQRAAGVATAIDVTRAETQLVAAAGATLVERNSLARATMTLARALGLEGRAPLVLADTLRPDLATASLPPDRDALVAHALRVRPDVATEAASLAATRLSAAALAAERLPRLELAADAGLSGPRPGDLLATRQIALQVTLPLADELRRRPRHAELRAAAARAEIVLADLRAEVAAQVDAALLDIASADARRVIAVEEVRLAALELAQARERFAAGVAGNLEVIAAQASLLRARDADIEGRYGAAAARVQLARAAGAAHTLREGP